MDLLIPLAAKSLLIAGLTLLILHLAQKRSAADRSFIAHLGLGAVFVLPFAVLLIPQLEVGASWMNAPVAKPVVFPEIIPAMAPVAAPASAATTGLFASIDWTLAAYFLPALVLILLTVTALLRLVVLKARADVLVEPHWLAALAHAQRRMGFKSGTALLTSNELRSPISWGLIRPVILLNNEAAEAHGEAEAIIAHELAHVARLDWVKLLLSRVTVALFWFNPFVWLLAREAHQLREEAADDAVLASDIEDTDYARLLVGIARHECRGLLIGAHGVAPARNSLARRVKRVLDGASARAPGGWRWSVAAGFFAAGAAVPLAALQFVPTAPLSAAAVDRVGGRASTPYYPVATPVVPLTAGVATAPRPAAPASPVAVHRFADDDVDVDVDVDPVVDVVPAVRVAVSPRPPVPPRPPRAFEQVVAMRAVGASPAYVAALRNAAPNLRIDDDDVLAMAAIGVTPDYVRAMAATGFRDLSSGDLIEMRAVGVTPADVTRYRRSGGHKPSIDQLVKMKALDMTPEDFDPDPSP